MVTTEQFINRYSYDKGVTFIDGWQRIDSSNPDDYTFGDCDDFALTVLILETGGWLNAIWALITFRAVFWLTHSPSNKWVPRHIVLHYRPKGWIDSTNREWRDTPTPHKRRLPLLWPWSLFRMLWGAAIKMIF